LGDLDIPCDKILKSAFESVCEVVNSITQWLGQPVIKHTGNVMQLVSYDTLKIKYPSKVSKYTPYIRNSQNKRKIHKEDLHKLSSL
jgi:hypothetical protein